MRSVVLLSLILCSCVEHTPPVTEVQKEEMARFDTLQSKVYKITRVFSGKIPCADCAGVDQQLILKGDTAGIYQLRETFLQASEDGDEVLISTGEWKTEKRGANAVYFLSEHNLQDSVRRLYFKPEASQLHHLDSAGLRKMSGEYRLKLKSQR